MALVKIPKAHKAQQQVLDESKRFNVLRMGRRWGKTTLIQRLLKPAITEAWKIGLWYPTGNDLKFTWRETKERFHEVIEYKDEQSKFIKLSGGGEIAFWSMDNPKSGRGNKYHRAFIDEFAKGRNEDVKEAFQQTIRPTLTDYKGDLWIFSTPHYSCPYFRELCENKNKHDDWMSWHMPTTVNPYIDNEEVEQAKGMLDPVIFAQEYMAEFVSLSNNPFAYSFDQDKHIAENMPIDPTEPVYLSFDFNIDPITCIVAQHSLGYIRILKEFRLSNSDIYELCSHIKAELGNLLFLVTGDATGKSGTAMTRGNVNYYTIIQQELNLTSRQISLPGVNPSINNSRMLLNAILSRHENFKINKVCKYVIEDLLFVESDETGGIDKTKDKHRSHLLDCLRYYLFTWHSNFIYPPK